MTSLPVSARHAPTTRPTYPVPTTAILIASASSRRALSSTAACARQRDGLEPRRVSSAHQCCQHTDPQGLAAIRAAPAVLRFPTVRILLDYRPALRARTGVGEFVHELARALSASGTGAADRVTVFTSSWRDRPDAGLGAALGAPVVDRKIPVRALAWAWNRLEWPPIEQLAGPADVVHSQSPLLIPARDAASVVTIHDLHFLSHPEWSEAEIRRDFPALVHDHARRADHVIVSSHFAGADVRARLGVPQERITVCSPGVPQWASEIAHARDPQKAQSTQKTK